jgi:hypothetical protein
MISSTTGVDIYLHGTGQVAPLFYPRPCRAERTLIIADLAMIVKLPHCRKKNFTVVVMNNDRKHTISTALKKPMLDKIPILDII